MAETVHQQPGMLPLRRRPRWKRLVRFPLLGYRQYRIQRRINPVWTSLVAAWQLAALTLKREGRMPNSVNQAIADQLVERQFLAGRVETQERREVLALLALLEADLLAVLKTEDPFAIEQLARRRRAVEIMVRASMEPLITSRYAQIAAQVDAVLVRLAQAEARVTQQIINEATNEETLEDVPPAGLVRLAVTQTLFPSPAKPTDLSTTGADWWTRQGEGLAQRLGDQLLVSAALGESVAQATTKLTGTRAAGYQDGLMAKAREDAARLLRTQTTNALGEAHAAVGRVNPGQGLVLIHSSILDSKTSSICLGRHGLRFDPVTHEPIGHSVPYLNGVPYHPSCRSSILIVLRHGGPIRQEDAAQWLRRQGTAFQDALLGPTRARMFRADTLGSLKNLIDAATGKPLTLEELDA